MFEFLQLCLDFMAGTQGQHPVPGPVFGVKAPLSLQKRN